jgi:hypothetical protein
MMKALGRFRCRRVETGDNGHLQMKSAKNAQPTESFDIRSGTFMAAFPGRAFGKRDRRATGPRLDRALKVLA